MPDCSNGAIPYSVLAIVHLLNLVICNLGIYNLDTQNLGI